MSELSDNLQRVEERIQKACARSGRDRNSVELIAVSKTKPASMVLEMYDLGQRDFGENRPQEIRDKSAVCPEDIRWHMIGHLQKNKVKNVIGTAVLIHSVDSVALAGQIEKEAAKQGRTVRILLEVNIAREESKWGFTPEDAPAAARAISAFPHVRILGLMTSAPATEDPETNRIYFRGLRDLALEMAKEKLIAGSDPDFHLPVLSMGMTGDYEVAVEEGATMVRVGTAVFGKRN